MADSRLILLPVAYWLLLVGCVRLVEGENVKGCTTDHVNQTVTVKCYWYNFYLPPPTSSGQNFDFDLLPSNITNLEFISMKVRNFIDDGYQPLPQRDKLTQFYVRKMNARKDHPVFPLNGFLIRNKGHIKELLILETKLGALTEGHFSGFNQLETLYINDAQIPAIGPEIFASLGLLKSGSLIEKYRPQLREVTISGNRRSMKRLDWSFLRPISEVVEMVDVSDNSLTLIKMSLSRTFKLKRGRSFNFKYNQMEKFPPAIISTFVAQPGFEVKIHGGTVCRNRLRCFCSTTSELEAWLAKHHLLKPSLPFTSCPNETLYSPI